MRGLRDLTAVLLLLVPSSLLAQHTPRAGCPMDSTAHAAMHGMSGPMGMHDMAGHMAMHDTSGDAAMHHGMSDHAAMRDMSGHMDMTGCAPQDSAFARMQARGKQVMGVDQYTSTHRFDSLADGGRIVLQRDSADTVGTRTIREHLQHIARAFRQGDFSLPMQVHDRDVPGTRVMAEKSQAIEYVYSPLPRGGEVRIRSHDPAAVAAIHEFLAFQRGEHRVGGQSMPAGEERP